MLSFLIKFCIFFFQVSVPKESKESNAVSSDVSSFCFLLFHRWKKFLTFSPFAMGPIFQFYSNFNRYITLRSFKNRNCALSNLKSYIFKWKIYVIKRKLRIFFNDFFIYI